MSTPAFMIGAPCTQVDPDVFFTPEGGGRHKDWESPRQICRGCDVQAACLAWALETRDAHAMLGGLTPDERKPLLPPLAPSMRLPIRHGTVAGEKAHRRRGERPCTACKRACNIARRDREFRAAQEAS